MREVPRTLNMLIKMSLFMIPDMKKRERTTKKIELPLFSVTCIVCSLVSDDAVVVAAQ